MGDRGNIKFTFDTEEGSRSIFLYTHWQGSDLPGVLKEILKTSRDRWDDPSYACRIMVQAGLEIMGARTDSPTGFGLSPSIDDNEYPIFELDMNRRSISFHRNDGEPTWSFQEFSELERPSWENILGTQD